MKKLEHKQRRLETQDFRYGIIAELVNPYLCAEEFKTLLKTKASREYDIPNSKKRNISPATIRSWVKLFQEQGKDGLLPQLRSDRGKAKSFTEQEQHELLEYLEEHPDISAAAAVIGLQRSGKITTAISQSSLSRFVLAQGLTRTKRMAEKNKEQHLKYQFQYPMECLQADAMHAFLIPDASGKMRKAILLAFIDDATRRIVYSNFAFTERSYEFEKGVKHILTTHGHIGRLYTDNGATFVSDQTKRILSILGIPLIHSRPGKPAGRGKIERVFRTIRDQFLRPLAKDEITCIDQLNILFRTWLESDYHRNPHRGLQNKTPLECWLQKSQFIIAIKHGLNLDDVFLHELPRKIYKDNTFSLCGILYEVPGGLAEKNVKIRFDPIHVNPIHVYSDGKYIADAKIVDTYANCKIIRNTHSKTITEVQSSSEVHTKRKQENSFTESSLAS